MKDAGDEPVQRNHVFDRSGWVEELVETERGTEMTTLGSLHEHQVGVHWTVISNEEIPEESKSSALA